MYQTVAGGLSDDQHVNAIGIADLATSAILAIQGETWSGDLSPHLETLAANNAVLHQASGMVSVQLAVGVGEALVRLRAHAFSEARSLAQVSDDVVGRRSDLAKC